MPDIRALRLAAFTSQKERCFYCGVRMWNSDPEAFARKYGLTPEQLARVRCTAEHLLARKDGGKHAGNVVAACLHCNQNRHHQRPAPAAAAHRQNIQRQLKNRTWHRRWVYSRGLLPSARAVTVAGKARTLAQKEGPQLRP